MQDFGRGYSGGRTMGWQDMDGRMSADLPQPLFAPDTRGFVGRAASCRLPVLLLGETGTGKSFLARKIHETDARSDGPCVEIGCGTIARDLMERELFGHERGAFTGAERSMPGFVNEAEGGTLILNELEAIECTLQPKILDLADSQRVRSVGSTRVRTVDVRLIFTTNCDLQEALESGRLREDLYYRIRMLMHTLPPLRRRRDDIPTLARIILSREWHLVRGSIAENGPPELSAEADAALQEYHWPGNMRELKAVVLGAAIENGHRTIGEAQVRRLLRQVAGSWTGSRTGNRASARPERYQAPKDPEDEKRRISMALAEAEGNKTHAAQSLGMSRTTLWERIRRHGLADAV